MLLKKVRKYIGLSSEMMCFCVKCYRQYLFLHSEPIWNPDLKFFIPNKYVIPISNFSGMRLRKSQSYKKTAKASKQHSFVQQENPFLCQWTCLGCYMQGSLCLTGKKKIPKKFSLLTRKKVFLLPIMIINFE